MPPSPASDHSIRWGVIGYGQIARDKTVPGILAAPSATLVAVADCEPARRELAADELPDAAVDAGADELLARADIDAVYIALPTAAHRDAVLQVAAAGKHVLVEKPVALSAADTVEMVAACERAGVRLMGAYMSRFGDAYQRARELIADGRLGRMRHADAVFCYDAVACYPPDSPGAWRWSDPDGGGPLLDIGIYLVFALRELLADPVVAVSASACATRAPDQVQADSVVAWMRTAGGTVITLRCAFSHNEQRLSFHGEDGEVELVGVFAQPAMGWLHVRAPGYSEDLAADHSKKAHYAHYTREVEHFSRALLDNSPHQPDGPAVLADMRVLDALRASLVSGTIQTIEAEEVACAAR